MKKPKQITEQDIVELQRLKLKEQEEEIKRLKKVFRATHKTKYELIEELEECKRVYKENLKLIMDSATIRSKKYQDRISELEQQVANLKREKVAMQTR